MKVNEAFEQIDCTNYQRETKIFILSILSQLEEKNGDIRDVDVALVKIAGRDHHQSLMCAEVINKEGVTCLSASGNTIKHPALSAQVNLLNSIRSTLRDLGIMGVSRRQAPAPNLLADSKILEALGQ